MKKPVPTFWISNICNRNVSLADLNLTVPAFRSINLLDKRHYQYTLERLQASVTNGSIFKKSDKIKVRQIAPVVIQPSMPFLKETFIPSREKSVLSIKEEHYAELEINDIEQKKKDEEYANETAEEEMNEIKPFTVTKG